MAACLRAWAAWLAASAELLDSLSGSEDTEERRAAAAWAARCRPQRSAEELMAAPNLPSYPISEPLLRRIGALVMRRCSARAEERSVATGVLDLADGATTLVIVATAEVIGADTIVIGSRGLRHIETLTFGSVSDEARRTARCRCIAVH